MNGVTCFICGETYYNDKAEIYIKVTRIERDGARKKTTKWGGMVCDKCIHELFGKEGGEPTLFDAQPERMRMEGDES